MSDSNSHNTDMLRAGTMLNHDKYRVVRHLASGGFGNTYEVENTSLKSMHLAMKEFFIKGDTHRESNSKSVTVSNRDKKEMFESCKAKFKTEAERLSQLRNEHIVVIHDFFEENGTAYYVMEYVGGKSLSQILKEQAHPFSERQALSVLHQMLDALECIHSRQIWHMDIKPGNIMMDSKGKCTLIDFGASKQTDVEGMVTASTSLAYTPGYAPPEQVGGNKEKWGPWTDIFALGSTIYNLLTGHRPPNHDDVIDRGAAAYQYPGHVSDSTKYVLGRMMDLSYKQRPQSVDDVVQLLNGPVPADGQSATSSTMYSHGATTAIPASASIYAAGSSFLSSGSCSRSRQSGNRQVVMPPDSQKKSHRGLIVALCSVLFLLIAGLVFILIKNNQDERETERKLAEMTAQQEQKKIELELATNELEAEKLKLEEKENAEKAAKAEKARQEKSIRQKEADDRRKEEAGPKVFEVDGVQFTMVYVAGGTFNMGATSDQSAYADADESPAHSVTLSGFYIGQTEVTQELWLAVMDSNPSDFYGSQRPVENVTWSDCQRFISKLNGKTGRHFRLPTEAEWEYAARGGKSSSHYLYAGSDYLDNVAWYYDNAYNSYDSSDYGTHNVATKSPNELGIYDMSGNVWELCQDWYGEGYYKHSPRNNPKGPSSGSYRVRRGGSWGSNDCYSSHCRVSNRGVFAPGNHFDGVGMRLAL